MRAEALATRWHLDLGAPFPRTPGSQQNLVLAARRHDGQHCVLKISPDLDETHAEIAALTFWDGRGAVRLLASDAELGALLLERVEPGTMLAELAAHDDAAATRVAVGVLRDLWRPASEGDGLRSLASWCAAYDRNRSALQAGVEGFPIALFERADALRGDLLGSTRAPVALHGDLHHFNVLQSERAGWLAIDPKGLVGDRYFDVCQFLRNPKPEPLEVNRRRLDLFCAELDLDPTRTREWCVVHAVLDACWSFEDGKPVADKVAYAEQTLLY